MRLRYLLFEDASDEAHRRGLEPAGYGRWKNAQGVIVARTVDGRLVGVQKKGKKDKLDKSKTKTPTDAKPTTMSAKDAGTQPSNTPTSKDVAKTTGTFKSKSEENSPQGDSSLSTSSVSPNPYQPDFVLPYKVASDAQLEQLRTEHPEIAEALETYHPAEDVYLLSTDEMDQFLHPKKQDVKALKHVGDQQFISWRQKLTADQQDALAGIHEPWQIEGKEELRSRGRLDRINQIVNTICNGNPPATLTVTAPLERGMSVWPDELENFLGSFATGESINLPPCGFSLSSQVAREFATEEDGISVIMRLSPTTDGTVHGLALFGVPKVEDYFTEPHRVALMEPEFEVIRYSGPTARVASINKLVSLRPNGPEVLAQTVYLIDLIEDGITPKLQTESVEYTKGVPKSFWRWLNTCLGGRPAGDFVHEHITYKQFMQ